MLRLLRLFWKYLNYLLLLFLFKKYTLTKMLIIIPFWRNDNFFLYWIYQYSYQKLWKKRELIFNMFSLLNISFLSPCSIWLIFIHLTLNRILIHSHKTSFYLNAECINHLTNSIQFFGIQKTATFKQNMIGTLPN